MTRASFSLDDAKRIANVVRAVEEGNRNEAPLRFRRVETPSRGGGVFRMATFTGAWSINTPKTVTFRASTATVQAYNVFQTIFSECGGSPVAIGRDGTAWYVIAAGCVS